MHLQQKIVTRPSVHSLLAIEKLCFDLWESERLVFFERNWCLDQVDALLQFFLGFCLLLLLLPLHPVVIPQNNKLK